MVVNADEAELRVLVVDDELDSANSLSFLLQLSGCLTAVAFGGDSTYRMLQLFKPGLVFLDLRMPGYDGCGILNRAKTTLPGVEDIIFVCLTGCADEEERALASGFDLFVAKPMDPARLGDIVGLAQAWRRRHNHAREAPELHDHFAR